MIVNLITGIKLIKSQSTVDVNHKNKILIIQYINFLFLARDLSKRITFRTRFLGHRELTNRSSPQYLANNLLEEKNKPNF